MTDTIMQFGTQPEEKYKDRVCAYAVVFNDGGQLLVLKVGTTYHLPGGGIDPGEDSETAVVREAYEEAGCRIANLQYLGKANQFFLKTDKGPLNKLGTFYKARIVDIDPSKGIEADHKVCWLTPDEFIKFPSGDFQKWAVKKAIKLMI